MQELAEDAFEDSVLYEYKGQPLYFSYKHYYAMVAMLQNTKISSEEQILLMFWIATHNPTEIAQLRKKWRKNQDLVFDEFDEFPERFGIHPASNEMLEIAEIASKLWKDVENSADSIDDSDDDNSDNMPKK